MFHQDEVEELLVGFVKASRAISSVPQPEMNSRTLAFVLAQLTKLRKIWELKFIGMMRK